jgi:pimeloyl-ACP methyl ester carboxylesterase
MVAALLLALAAPAAAQRPADFARAVDIGRRALHLECRGAGTPAVVLEAGFRTRADVWSTDFVRPGAPRAMVLPSIARFTRVCAYDRPGTATVLDDTLYPSRSDPASMPRTARDAVADLHALLRAARVAPPYVLVGHSFGGLIVRLYASTYPREVAGLVLVDAFAEGAKTGLTGEQWTGYDRVMVAPPPELARYGDLETMDFGESVAQMSRAASARPLPPMPLTVLSKGRPFAMPPDTAPGLPEAIERAWGTAQIDLARLAPGARHVVARASGHYVQQDQPELVIDAVRRVVTAVRRGRLRS